MSDQFAVYVNTAAGEGFVGVVDSYETVPSNDGHANLQGVFNSREEAEDILRKCLFEPIVAVFLNGPTGDAYRSADPTGNWRGSGHHPFTVVAEFPYFPEIRGDRERAMMEADKEVRRLKSRD